jgi:hypothetical protein
MTLHDEILANAASDARRELARTRIDLRIHGLVMLGNAILIPYVGFQIWAMDIVTVSNKPIRIALPDLWSDCVLAVSFALAAICLFDAFRSWQEAATARAAQSRYPVLLHHRILR